MRWRKKRREETSLLRRVGGVYFYCSVVLLLATSIYHNYFLHVTGISILRHVRFHFSSQVDSFYVFRILVLFNVCFYNWLFNFGVDLSSFHFSTSWGKIDALFIGICHVVFSSCPNIMIDDPFIVGFSFCICVYHKHSPCGKCISYYHIKQCFTIG